jgi:hypothetical protein
MRARKMHDHKCGMFVDRQRCDVRQVASLSGAIFVHHGTRRSGPIATWGRLVQTVDSRAECGGLKPTKFVTFLAMIRLSAAQMRVVAQRP